ncbi:hypothetical protein [Sphingomonas sp. 1P08PE]|uniref:hypothetical protein n=1 Tax=Sphingomonas sp. 1P08PE TaxID=554122 RepID=UPI00399F2EF0
MSTWALLSVAQLLAAPPVAGWSDLPVFPLPRAAIAADASMFVKAEVDAGRCRTPDGRSLDAPVAILVGTAGMVRQIVPQAIGCPTVEQFTVGYLLSLTRGGPGSAQLPRAGWYSLTVGYRW